MTHTYLILGHVTVDRGPGSAALPGGAVYYGAAAAAALGWRVRCVTRAATHTPPELPEWLSKRVTWCILPSPRTTVFENTYDADFRRSQRVLACAEPIGGSDVPSGWRDADVVHLAPVAAELKPDVIQDVRAAFVGLAVQGWLRDIADNGDVTAGPWYVPAVLERRAQAIAVSSEDLRGTGEDALAVADRAPIVAVTLGALGADLFHHGERTHIPARAGTARDATGAGAVFAATLFVKLAEGASVDEAGRWATTQASLSVGAEGVGGLRNREDLARLV